jgi:hypothetical protein
MTVNSLFFFIWYNFLVTKWTMFDVLALHFLQKHFMFTILTAIILFSNYGYSWSDTRREVASTYLKLINFHKIKNAYSAIDFELINCAFARFTRTFKRCNVAGSHRWILNEDFCCVSLIYLAFIVTYTGQIYLSILKINLLLSFTNALEQC